MIILLFWGLITGLNGIGSYNQNPAEVFNFSQNNLLKNLENVSVKSVWAHPQSWAFFNSSGYNLSEDALSINWKNKSIKIGAEFLAGCAGMVIPVGMSLIELNNNESWKEQDLYEISAIGSFICVTPLVWGTGRLFGDRPSFLKTALFTVLSSPIATYLFLRILNWRNFYELSTFAYVIIPIGAVLGADL